MCKSCNTTLRVPDEHLGKQARCPSCQNLNVIQADSAVPPAKPIAPAAPIQDPGFENPYSASAGMTLPPGGPAGRAYSQPHRGGLVLGLGIMSLMCNFFLIPGILAWIFGNSDLKKMSAGTMDPEGKGLTQAGMILGIVSTALVALLLVFYVFLIVIAVGASAIQ